MDMKRCPDCGFRAKDDICPLCGVRMKAVPGKIQTHAHTQPGEKCTLPRQEQKPIQIPTARDTNRKPQGKGSWVSVVVIIILFNIIRSCAA